MKPFQNHLLHFSTPPPNARLTLLSGLRGALSLGLNFPISLLLAIGLKIMYTPFPFLSSVRVSDIPQHLHRTQLEGVSLPHGKESLGRDELLRMLEDQRMQKIGASASERRGLITDAINTMHVIGFWTMTADARTHYVRRDDVKRFQEGCWEEQVVKRRRGRGDVLPFWRGGPIGVGGHSWAVNKFFGVRVYEREPAGKKEL